LKTLISLVSSRSLSDHGHSDEIQRKFFRKGGDGFFQGQQGLLDWVSLVSFGQSLKFIGFTDYQIQMKSVLVNSMSTIVKPFEYISEEFNDLTRPRFRRLMG